MNDNIREAYFLCRHMASVVLVFLISDLDRIHVREKIYSCPIAYALKWYSLNTNIMRQMINDVLNKCFQEGLYVKVVSNDVQWYNMVIRANS